MSMTTTCDPERIAEIGRRTLCEIRANPARATVATDAEREAEAAKDEAAIILLPLSGETRTCTKCARAFPIEQFRPEPKRTSGYNPHCDDCRRAYGKDWYERNKEKKQAQNRAWKQANAEVYRAQQIEYAKVYREKNRERIRQYWAKYNVKRNDYLRARDKQRYWSDPEGQRARAAQWKAANPDKLRQRERQRLIIGRPDDAIEQGKTSPICRRVGFALVRILNAPKSGCQAARFRAARLDKPINAGERVVCHYSFIASANQWVILRPPLGIHHKVDVLLFGILERREKGRSGKRGRGRL